MSPHTSHRARALRFAVGSSLVFGLGACDKGSAGNTDPKSGETKAKEEHSEDKPRVNEGPSPQPVERVARPNEGREPEPNSEPKKPIAVNSGPEVELVHTNEGPIRPPETDEPAPSPKTNSGPKSKAD